MSHILRTGTEHITAPQADEGNYAYCQSRGAHNIPMEISIEKTDNLMKNDKLTYTYYMIERRLLENRN